MAQEMTLQEFLQRLVNYRNLLKEREASFGSLAVPIQLINQLEHYEYAIERTKEALKQNVSYETLQQDLAPLNLDFSAEITIKAERKPFDGRNPYRGLERFTEKDAEFFFGRTVATAELISKIRQIIEKEIEPNKPALLTVIGASGSGKSSLVRAGLIPEFSQNFIEGSEHWPIRVMVPGRSPLDTLSIQFKGLLDRGAPLIRKELDSGPKAFHLLLRELFSDQPDNLYYTLVIDQLEELFTLCENEQERRDFIDLILYEAYHRDHRGLIIITMRADFYSRALAYKNLADAITVHQYPVSPMDEQELREAILLPAETVGLEMERSLALALVQDTAKEPGRLPLLQHAMLELFNRRSPDNVMTLAAYNEIGGVQGALTHRADAVYKQLKPEQQRLARRIFVELTELGEGISGSRRRVRRSQLDYLGDPTQIEEVLNQLSSQDARLVVSGKEVEVTHEALIQQWSKLRSWLEEDRESLRLHRRLTKTAQEWRQVSDEDKSAYLYRGALLATAEEWCNEHTTKLTEIEQAFLNTSLAARDAEEREKEAQRQRELEQQRALAQEQQKRAEEAEARRQAETQRAEEAEAREHAEKQRADAEQQRAEEAKARQHAETERASAETGKRIRNAAIYGLIAGGLGFSLSYLTLFLPQVNPDIGFTYEYLIYLTILRVLPGAVAGLIFVLLVNRTDRTNILQDYLAFGATGAGSAAFALLFHTYLQQFGLTDLLWAALLGGIWGGSAGLVIRWSRDRFWWQATLLVALTGSLTFWLGNYVIPVALFENVPDTVAFWLYLLAGAAFPLCLWIATTLTQPTVDTPVPTEIIEAL